MFTLIVLESIIQLCAPAYRNMDACTNWMTQCFATHHNIKVDIDNTLENCIETMPFDFAEKN